MSDHPGPADTGGAGVVRVVVIDDHRILREGIIAIVSRDRGIRVVGEGSNGREACECFRALLPDVTLIDLQMPEMDGVAAIEAIRAFDGAARLLVLTTFDDDDGIERALRAGARGYLLKDATPEEIISAIYAVHSGQTRVAPSIAAKLVDRMTQVMLTKRELTVLRLMAEGKANKEIGVVLSIAESTVKVHLSRVFEKLHVSTRTEAVAAAVRRGLVRFPGQR